MVDPTVYWHDPEGKTSRAAKLAKGELKLSESLLKDEGIEFSNPLTIEQILDNPDLRDFPLNIIFEDGGEAGVYAQELSLVKSVSKVKSPNYRLYKAVVMIHLLVAAALYTISLFFAGKQPPPLSNALDAAVTLALMSSGILFLIMLMAKKERRSRSTQLEAFIIVIYTAAVFLSYYVTPVIEQVKLIL